MNKVILMGRLTRDPEVRYTQGENSLCIANFTVAVDRRMNRNAQDGGQTADFIPCVVFGKQAEHVEKYYRKGLKTCLSGRIQTRNYTNREGVKVYVTEVVVEDLEFAERRRQLRRRKLQWFRKRRLQQQCRRKLRRLQRTCTESGRGTRI